MGRLREVKMARSNRRGFLAKAPANVVEGLRKRRQELDVLLAKAHSKWAELGCN